MTDLLDRLYATLVESDEEHGRGELPESAYREVPGNAAKLVTGFTLQKIGDRIADPKTVLAWMLTSLHAPAFATSLLVPIREAGALLPQALLVPAIRRHGLRSRVWSVGAIGQSLAVAGIGIAGFFTAGLGLGLSTLGGLGLFALARAVSSISSKDVIGKTIPAGNRGSVTGIAASVAGFAAIATGILIATTLGGTGPNVLAAVVGGSALFWLGGAVVFLTVDEEPSPADRSDPGATMHEAFSLLIDDVRFRRFVIARSLMLVTALSPPYVVALSASINESSVAGVGPFVVATGIAGLIAAPIWGRLADRSSRLVMMAASGTTGAIIVGYLGLRRAGLDATWWLGPATYLLLAIAHAGARMGRKTYVIDMAGEDRRISYVAVSNTLIGMVLLAAGAVGGVLARFGAEWTLVVLAIAGFVGAGVSLSMDEIHDGVS